MARQERDVVAAIAAFRELLPTERVVTEEDVLRQTARDMGDFRPRQMVAMLRPSTSEQVQAIVGIARAHHVPLYPVSTGKNWGVGSRQPVNDGCVLLDLSGMRRIREVNERRGYAIVEPGVTQTDLVKALRGTRWTLNITASCAHSTVLGHALERGIGTTRQRTEDLTALELVLGTGEIIRTGFWARGASDLFYRHGIGPDLLPLFCQSNFAVATAGAIELIPRPERVEILDARFSAAQLPAALACTRRLYEEGVIHSVVKIYNANALRGYGLMKNVNEDVAYQLYGTLYGRADRVGRDSAIARAELLDSGAFSRVVCHTVDEAHPLPPDEVPEMVQHYQAFRPTCLTHASFHANCDLDRHSEVGWLIYMPVIPHDPEDLQRALRMVDDVAHEAGVPINATLNILSSRVVDLVVTLRFRRGTEESKRAHGAFELLHRRFENTGYFSYRSDVDHMDPGVLYRSPEYIAVLRRLKQALDPDGIISPGRYVPDPLGSSPPDAH